LKPLQVEFSIEVTGTTFLIFAKLEFMNGELYKLWTAVVAIDLRTVQQRLRGLP
jgi:hypothetical protein